MLVSDMVPEEVLTFFPSLVFFLHHVSSIFEPVTQAVARGNVKEDQFASCATFLVLKFFCRENVTGRKKLWSTMDVV